MKAEEKGYSAVQFFLVAFHKNYIAVKKTGITTAVVSAAAGLFMSPRSSSNETEFFRGTLRTAQFTAGRKSTREKERENIHILSISSIQT